MKKKLLTLSLACLASLSLTQCQQNQKKDPFETDEVSYDGINLHYNSSDDDMNTFLNDFTHRNMRYDSDSCGEFPVGGGTGFAKNWETMGITFQNSSQEVYREDKFNRIAQYLIGASQDDQGLIYNTPLTNEPALSEAGKDLTGYCIPQGWPFPSWRNSVENFLDIGNLDSVHTCEFNFNDSEHLESKRWRSSSGTFTMDNKGYANFSSGEVEANNSFMFYRDQIDTLLSYSHGIDTRYAPMIDIEIAFSGHKLKDYNIIFKTSGSDEWKRAPQSIYASTSIKNMDGFVHTRQFFDMYLHPDWNHQIITDIGVEFVGNDGSKFDVEGSINFLRPSYDTRQSNATYQFILALYNYFIYTRDTKTLNKLMNKARKGILFLTHALEGEKGLLSLEYLYGHDGVTPNSFRENDRLAYHGIGNGYFDLTVSPIRNLEANTYFYQALRAMAILEEVAEPVTGLEVKNRMPYEDPVPYNYNTESLNSLADLVKSNMEKNIEVVQEENTNSYTVGDWHYVNKGGFYNPETGRFALGINEYNGEILDYGYVYWNLEAICAGIGTKEQQLSIMNWIDGRRIVESDKSKGDDIYFYEFAPRFSTIDTDDAMGFMTDENHYHRFFMYGYGTWSRQVQNGGAVIAWSYYDLVARSKVFGVDNAAKRLEGIKKWYMKVLDNCGYSYNFYGDYYDTLDSDATMDDPDMYYVYSIQQAATRGVGACGLDAEFIESVILIRGIPDALFGMDASHNDNLQFTYGENKESKYFEIFNMKYGDTVYSYRSKKNIMEVFNIGGQVSPHHKITYRYPTDNTNLTVKVNGEIYNDVEYINGYACVTLPFGNAQVRFG